MGEKDEKKQQLKDVWTMVLQQTADKKDSTVEPNVVVLGGQGTGKTTIVRTLLYREGGAAKSDGDAPESTTSLSYNYLRQGPRGSPNLRLTHIWELGGGNPLARLLDISVNVDNMYNSGLIVVADLSKPSEILNDVQFWLAAAKKRIKDVITKITQKRPGIEKKILARSKARLSKNMDFKQLEKIVCQLPVLIVANKFDKFKNKPVEKIRIMARFFRSLAHMYGAGLVYVDKSDSSSRLALLSHFASMQRMQRGETEKKKSKVKPPPTRLQDLEALSVPFGTDSMKAIGWPDEKQPVNPNVESLFDEWVDKMKSAFPPDNQKLGKRKDRQLELSAESSVDTMLQQLNIQAKQRQRGAALARKMAMATASGSK